MTTTLTPTWWVTRSEGAPWHLAIRVKFGMANPQSLCGVRPMFRGAVRRSWWERKEEPEGRVCPKCAELNHAEDR